MAFPSRILDRKLDDAEAPRLKNKPAADLPAKSSKAARAGRTALAVLKSARRPALVSTLGLLVVWLLGRVMEIIHGNVVFDPILAYWLGGVIYILTALWAIGSAICVLENRGRARRTRLAILSWGFLLALFGMFLWGFEGYQIASRGLLAAIAGSVESSQMAIFLLLKFHSFNPMLVLNLSAATLMGLPWDMGSLAPYVWSWNALFAFFIWSLAYGVGLAMQKDKRPLTSLHLFLAAFGLLGLIILRSVSTPTTQQMLVIQAAALIMLVFQILLAYALLRTIADGAENVDTSPVDAFAAYAHNPAKPPTKRFAGLPPAAVQLALVLFIVVPVMADVHTQFLKAAASKTMVNQLAAQADGAASEFDAVTAITIRSGPTIGDEVLGILTKGTRVRALARQKNWVRIGENQWIMETYLKPHGGQ